METEVKLTKLASCAGCGAKVGAGTLVQLLEGFRTHSDPRLLVGFDKSDDASVYYLDENTALVQTTDFFPPIVDDPFLFGQIAAANALSDVYAMGGEPKLCLNIMAVPESMPKEAVHGAAPEKSPDPQTLEHAAGEPAAVVTATAPDQVGEVTGPGILPVVGASRTDSGVHALGNRHAHGHRDALAKRTRRHLHARQQAALRVARAAGAELAEGLEFVELQVVVDLQAHTGFDMV